MPRSQATRWPRAASVVGALFALTILAAAHPVSAQGNFEIQVYGGETVEAGKTMVELHSNTAVIGTTRTIDGVVRTEGAWHETLEITHGFTPWFEVGFYTFTSVQPDTGWEWVGNHVRPRVRVPESWKWPVGVALSTEVGYQRRAFSPDTWTLELRPIVDQQWGKLYWAFNPALGLSLDGPNAGKPPEFEPAVKIGYEIVPKVSAGIEYYGSVGPVNRFDPISEQQHLLFPTIDVDLGPRWELNLGVGFGLTRSTDSLIVKMILGYRFDF
jgi:hypothetical protein